MSEFKLNLDDLLGEKPESAAILSDEEKSRRLAINASLEDAEIEIASDDFASAAAILDKLSAKYEDYDGFKRVSKVYWLRLLIEYKAHGEDELRAVGKEVLNNTNYKKACNYAKATDSPDYELYLSLKRGIDEDIQAELDRIAAEEAAKKAEAEEAARKKREADEASRLAAEEKARSEAEAKAKAEAAAKEAARLAEEARLKAEEAAKEAARLAELANMTVKAPAAPASNKEISPAVYSEDFVIENGVLVKYKGKEASITIPEGVTAIGKNAFRESKTLTTVTLPEGVESIGYAAFHHCTKLVSVSLPSTLVEISAFAFCESRSLSVINIPENLKRIGESAFFACNGLNAIALPRGVEYVGDSAFSSCIHLTDFTLQPGLKSLATSVLFDTRMKSLKIPNGVTLLRRSSLSYCTKLTSIELPDTLRSIGDRAFFGCKVLSSLDIPASVVSIGETVFSDCAKLKAVSAPAILKGSLEAMLPAGCKITWTADTAYTTADGFVIKDNILAKYIGTAAAVSVPEGVTHIAPFAFRECESITSTELPASLIEIGDHAFRNCRKLAKISMKNGVKTVGEWAFGGCHALKSLTLPDSVEIIEAYAFSYTGLTEIRIPNSVKTIGSHAFYSSALLSLTVPETVECLGDGVLSSALHIRSLTAPIRFKGVIDEPEIPSECRITWTDEEADLAELADIIKEFTALSPEEREAVKNELFGN